MQTPNSFTDMKETICPACVNEAIKIEDWQDKWYKHNNHLLYFKCHSCGVKLGSTPTMTGVTEVIVWEKSKEEK